MDYSIDDCIIALDAAKHEEQEANDALKVAREAQCAAADKVGKARQRLNEAVERRSKELLS